jgi:hypothetical protein
MGRKTFLADSPHALTVTLAPSPAGSGLSGPWATELEKPGRACRAACVVARQQHSTASSCRCVIQSYTVCTGG